MECDIPAALTVTAEPRDERHYICMYMAGLLYYTMGLPHMPVLFHSFIHLAEVTARNL